MAVGGNVVKREGQKRQGYMQRDMENGGTCFQRLIINCSEKLKEKDDAKDKKEDVKTRKK